MDISSLLSSVIKNALYKVIRASSPEELGRKVVVQGGTFNDLRAESAKYCASKDPDGFGIGGVFTADGMAEMLKTVNSILPEDKPRHLLGMGQEPIDLFDGAEFGCDTCGTASLKPHIIDCNFLL